MEEGRADLALQGAYLVADGRLGDVQLLRRAGEAHMPPGRFEDAQGWEGRQAHARPLSISQST
jgi:hypothetical protein